MIKRLLTNNIGLKLLALFAAMGLWLIVINIEDPEVTRTISGIPVVVEDVEAITQNGQVYTIISGSEATVNVKGPRSQVDKMTKDFFIAKAPFSEKSNVDAVPIYVSFKNQQYDKECEISQKTMTMRLSVENIIEKTYDIQISHKSELSDSYYLGKESINPATVTVSAPQSVIDTINKVTVEPDLGTQTENVDTSLNIHYYSGSGSELTLDSNTTPDIITTNYTADIYSVREVPLEFNTSGTVKEGYQISEIIGEKNAVKIAGPNAETVESVVIPAELINISGKSSDVTVSVDVSAQLPTGVYLCDEEDANLNVTIKIGALVKKIYNVPVSEIDKNNLPAGYSATISENQISVVLTGLQSAHDDFDINDLKPYVDLKNTEEGENEVIVKFILPESLKLDEEVRIHVILAADATVTNPETTTVAETTSATETSGEIQSSESTQEDETTVESTE